MTLIIAEAGVNHNGDEDMALALIDAAHSSGADVVKFQTFKAKSLVTEEAGQANYQVANTGRQESQLSMLSRLELSFDAHKRLLSRCNNCGIEFLSTAFDSESLSFLVNELGLKRLKVPSGELTNAPLLLEHAKTGCDLIVSTGMATLADIETALGIIAFGYTCPEAEEPSLHAFQKAYVSEKGYEALRQKVTLLHCTTEYPAPMSDINLNVIKTLGRTFDLPIGYSDHSEGIVVPIAAVALGAVLIEKHFTLDKSLPGPDHKASLEPGELTSMVCAIRQTEIALGNQVKKPMLSELKNQAVARKSLVAGSAIKAGEYFTSDNITIKRPGTGISPIKYWDFLGGVAERDYMAGDLIVE